MKEYEEFFKGRRVTLLGLGLLGRGVGDAEFLAECGANVTVTDIKTEEQLAESVERLRKYPNIVFHLGGHQKEDFEKCDLVIKSAGVRLDSPEIAFARAAGVPVAMSTALFAKYAMEAGAKIVGVTGTRGKTTVTRLIHYVLTKSGRTAYLGGNIRGISTLALLPKIQAGDIAVLELDSWQLQGFGDMGVSPEVAVFTNLMPDHLNYYESEEAYFSDKAKIFTHQKKGDVLAVGRSIAERIRAAQPPVAPVVPEAIPVEWNLKLLGEHNRENTSLAAEALRALGLDRQEIQKGCESFEQIEGRLQMVREIGGVKIYNDNNASTPEATIAALQALKSAGPLTLIVGGTDKNVELAGLAREIDSSVQALVLFSGTGTEKLKPLLSTRFEEADSLRDALAKAVKATPAGGVILFSPAFASFGPFVNYYDRNDQFLEIVTQLGDAA